MSIAIAIDPNLRIDGNATLAGFEDVMSGSVSELGDGMPVEVREPESGVVGDGQIIHIDQAKRLIQVAVDWKSLHLPVAS